MSSSLDAATLSHDDAGEVLALKASALSGLRAPEAEDVLLDARVRAYSSGCASVECEVEYVAALLAWSQGRVADALAAADTVLEVSEQQASWLRKSRPEASCSAAHWRARAYELRGMTHALREDFSSQATSLVRAFEEFDKGRVEDVHIEGQFLHNLAILAPDIDDSDVSTFVAARAERVAWNGQSAFFEFIVFNALGWCYARRGDHLGAFRHLRRAADVAPSLPLRITAILDRGFLARELGEVLTASDDLEHAVRLTSRVDWERVSGAERAALYSLAKQIAPTDPKRGRQLWDRFVALKSLVSPF